MDTICGSQNRCQRNRSRARWTTRQHQRLPIRPGDHHLDQLRPPATTRQHNSALIAAEKAGIIKPQVPVISGARHPEAQSVIRTCCQEMDSELWEIGTDFESAIRSQRFGTTPRLRLPNRRRKPNGLHPQNLKIADCKFPGYRASDGRQTPSGQCRNRNRCLVTD